MAEDQTTVAPAATDEDVERLRAELEQLKAENESLKSGSTSWWRTAAAIIVVVLASVMLALAVPAVWLNRVVMDTDTWVATVAPLASDPAIQDVVATKTSDLLVEQVDAANRLKSVLPEQLQQLAPIIASSVDGFIRTQTTNLVKSDKFTEIWTELNRAGHEALIAALTGERTGAVKYQPGVLTLDVGVLAEMVQQRLVDSGLEFAGRLPVSSINRQIEIFNSPALAQASVALGIMNQIAFILPVIGIALAGLGFLAGPDRRKVALWLGSGILVAGLLPLQAIYLSQFYVVSQLQTLADIPTAAAQNAYSIIFAQLITAEQTLCVLGLVILLGAIVSGPSRWAVALRGGLSGGLANASSHLELGRFGTWVAAHKRGLRSVGFIAAIVWLIALPAPRSIAQIVWLSVFAIVWVVLVEFFGAGGSAAPSPMTVEDQAEPAPDSAEAELVPVEDAQVAVSDEPAKGDAPTDGDAPPEDEPPSEGDEPPPAESV